MPSCAGEPVSTREGYHMYKADSGAIAVKPTHTIRAESGTIEMNKEIVLSTSSQNDRANNRKGLPGLEDISGPITYEYDFNDIVLLLYGVLGNISTTDVGGTGPVYKHAITPALCLPSFTYEEGIGRITDTANNRQNMLVKRTFGAIVSKLTLKIEGGIVMAESQWMARGQFIQAKLRADASAGSSVALSLDRVKGLTTDDSVNTYDTTPVSEVDAIASISQTARTITIATLGNSYSVDENAKVELVPLTPVYSEEPQLVTGSQVFVRFGDDLDEAETADAGCVRSATLVIDNEGEPQECLGDYSKSAGGVTAKGRTVTFEFTRSFKNKLDLDRYLQAKEFAIWIEMTNDVRVNASDTNNLVYKAIKKLPKCVVTGMPISRDNNGIYEYTCAVTALLDDTEGFDVACDVWNKNAVTVYNA